MKTNEKRGGEVFDTITFGAIRSATPHWRRSCSGFRAQAWLQLDLIAAAASAGDFSASVHALKGAALAMGATEIAETTAKLETVDFEADPAKRKRLVERLRMQVAAAEAAIARKAG